MDRFLPLMTLVCIWSGGHAARILGIFPHTGRSHFMVFEPLLRKLPDRGHHITVASFFPLKDPPANYTDISLEGISPVKVETVDLSSRYERSNLLLSGLGVERIVKQMFSFHPLDTFAVNVCEKLVDWPRLRAALQQQYDLVILEYFNSDCILGLLHVYNVRAPIVALSSCVLMPWTADRVGLSDSPSHVPLRNTYFTTKMNFWERLENSFLQIVYKYWFRSAIQIKEQQIIEWHLGQKIPDLRDLGKNISLILVNTHHALNGVRPLLPAVVEVGGIHLVNHTPRSIPNYIEHFIETSEYGVVVISFGSNVRTSSLPAYKERMIVSACATLNQSVIWKYEGSGPEGFLQGNILKVSWIPQYEILLHPKVVAFVGHGGLLSMTEAVSAGKPMVVVPMFGDQFTNAAAAEDLGVAVVVPYAELSATALAAAMQKAISPEIRLTAQRVSATWRDRLVDPLETAVYWTERVARWGPHETLHSSARDLTYIENTLLDVAATFILLIIITLLVLILALRLLLSMILRIGSVFKKKKFH